MFVCSDQVQTYLQECENRAAVVIQSFWRGFRERRHYSSTQRHMLRRERAVRTLQRGVHTHTSVKLYISAAGYCLLRLLFCFFQVRRFLQKRRAAKVPPLPPFWIGQKGLTDSRRAELNRQVDEYIATHQVRLISKSPQLLPTMFCTLLIFPCVCVCACALSRSVCLLRSVPASMRRCSCCCCQCCRQELSRGWRSNG